jgi:hypothetical protein
MKVELYYQNRPLTEIFSPEFVKQIEARSVITSNIPVNPVAPIPNVAPVAPVQQIRPAEGWITFAESGRTLTPDWKGVNGLKIYSQRRQRWLDNLSILGVENGQVIFGWPANGNKPELRHNTASINNVFIEANRLQ